MAQIRWELRMTLSEWDALPPEDQAEKLAVWLSRAEMQAVEAEAQRREIEKARAKQGR